MLSTVFDLGSAFASGTWKTFTGADSIFKLGTIDLDKLKREAENERQSTDQKVNTWFLNRWSDTFAKYIENAHYTFIGAANQPGFLRNTVLANLGHCAGAAVAIYSLVHSPFYGILGFAIGTACGSCSDKTYKNIAKAQVEIKQTYIPETAGVIIGYLAGHFAAPAAALIGFVAGVNYGIHIPIEKFKTIWDNAGKQIKDAVDNVKGKENGEATPVKDAKDKEAKKA